MSEREWNEDYLQGFTPWDTATAEPTLVDFVRSRGLTGGRALDVGCGTGTHALWLASQGFDVVGIDISPRAVELARAKAGDAKVRGSIRFEVRDFLASTPEGGPFDLVFDRGVFHVFDEAEDRSRFAAQVSRCLALEGSWLSLVGSTEGPPREEGPPRRSARDIANAIEPVLEIVELRGTVFDPDRPVPPRAWICVSTPRSVPAQPSTART